jgi:hypothetical protein
MDSGPGTTPVGGDTNNFFMPNFEDTETVTISRMGATVGASVSWQVIEFEDGVKVSRGISSIPARQPSKTITIPQITTIKDSMYQAIPIVYVGNADNAIVNRTEETMCNVTIRSIRI